MIIINTVYDLCLQSISWYLQSATDDHQGNIFPNSIDEELELNNNNNNSEFI